MKKKMRKALEASIEKWERNASVATAAQLSNVALNGLNCPLCVACGMTEDRQSECSKCPVMQHTGEYWCDKTPYYACLDAKRSSDLNSFRHHAQLEVDFLKSLLPHHDSKETKND